MTDAINLSFWLRHGAVHEMGNGYVLAGQRTPDPSFGQFLELVRLFPHCFPVSARSYFGLEARPLLPPGEEEDELDALCEGPAYYRMWKWQRNSEGDQ
jgi:hypothetical protein